MTLAPRAVGLMALGLAFAVRANDPLTVWFERNARVSDATRLGLAHNSNHVFVAVGQLYAGEIFTSTDATRWQLRTRVGPPLWSVAWGQDRFIALGQSGHIAISSDNGNSWLSAMFPENDGFFWDIVYGHGRFVGVGERGPPARSGFVVSSTNGADFVRTTMRTGPFHGVTAGNNSFIAVGDHIVGTSVDGITWDIRSTSCRLRSLAYGRSIYAALGQCDGGATGILVSTNGWEWTNRAAIGPLLVRIRFAGDRFVAVGSEGTVVTSTDGVQWTRHWAGTESTLFDVTKAGDRWIGVGQYDAVVQSADGTNWISLGPKFTSAINDIVAGPEGLVAVGESSVFAFRDTLLAVSADGKTWNRISLPETMTNTVLHGAAYGNGRYIVAGANEVLVSTNGVDWHIKPAPGFFAMRFAFGDQRFVAASGGNLQISTNGEAWTTTRAAVGDSLGDVTYGNGQFVAVGFRGFDTSLVLTSSDGSTWQERTLPPYGRLLRIAYGNGRFVAVGIDSATLSKSSLLTSTDGLNWTSFPTVGMGILHDIAFGHGVFVIVSSYGSRFDFHDHGIHISANGMNWEARGLPRVFIKSPRSIGVGKDGFVVGGNNGEILQSGNLSQVSLSPKLNGPGFNEIGLFAGPVNQAYVIQASTDLITWTNVATVLKNSYATNYVDPLNPPSQPRRFYRAIQRE